MNRDNSHTSNSSPELSLVVGHPTTSEQVSFVCTCNRSGIWSVRMSEHESLELSYILKQASFHCEILFVVQVSAVLTVVTWTEQCITCMCVYVTFAVFFIVSCY